MVGTPWNNIHDGMIARLNKRVVLLPIGNINSYYQGFYFE